jgi:hypothetical protein
MNAGTIPVPESGGFDDNGQEPSIRLLDSSIHDPSSSRLPWISFLFRARRWMRRDQSTMMLPTFRAQATADNRGERARERGLEVGPHRDARRIDAVLPRIFDWIPPVMDSRGAQARFLRKPTP